MFKVSRNSAPLYPGFTLIELVIATTMAMLILGVLMLILRPVELQKRGRDGQRINDLSLLERLISEYKLDHGTYPDSVSTLRLSNVLPDGNLDLNLAKNGWIKADMSAYNAKVPTDPLNTSPYVYSYIHDDNGFELNAKLEYNLTLMSTDGGNNANVYELGNNLTLISP